MSISCRTYTKTGQCPNGNKCFLAHSRPTSNAALVQMQSSSRPSSSSWSLTPPGPINRSVTALPSVSTRSPYLTDRIWGSSSRSILTRPDPISSQSRQSSTQSNIKTDLYKTELCKSWSITNACPYGAKCQFAHGEQELRQVNRHPKFKTVECNQYSSTGLCSFGSRCVFYHDESERRLPESLPAAAPALTGPSAMTRSDVSSWLISDQATPYIANSSSTSNVVSANSFKRTYNSNSEADLIKRIETSFPMFGSVLVKAVPQPESPQTDLQQSL